MTQKREMDSFQATKKILPKIIAANQVGLQGFVVVMSLKEYSENTQKAYCNEFVQQPSFLFCTNKLKQNITQQNKHNLYSTIVRPYRHSHNHVICKNWSNRYREMCAKSVRWLRQCYKRSVFCKIGE